MSSNRLLSVLVPALCLALAAACGEKEEPIAPKCEGVHCGDNATCDPDTGECVCEAGFTKVNDNCVNSRLVACKDVAPANASSQLEHVEIKWTEDDGWGEPAECDWSCIPGYGEHPSVPGQCHQELEVECRDEPPENASSTETTVIVIWSEVYQKWSDDLCPWECDAGFGEHGSAPGGCLDEVVLECRDDPPENAETTESGVDVTITWDEDALEWTDHVCPWECDKEYDEHSSSPGECLDEVLVDCRDDPPEHAESTSDTTLINWVEGDDGWGWTDDRCPWQCMTEYGFHPSMPDECHDELEVDCKDESPENAEPTAETVTVQWVEGDDGWSWTDERCPWECEENYGEHPSRQGECHDALVVDCEDESPENAEPIAETVAIFWVEDDQDWTSDACLWKCDPNHHEYNGVCMENVEIEWCAIHAPDEVAAPIDREIEFIGEIRADGTGEEDELAGLSAIWCHGPAPISVITGVEHLDCFTAGYDPQHEGGDNDGYVTLHAFDTPGEYEYVFAFSGDGGDSWQACDLDGFAGLPLEPGEASIFIPRNADMEDWVDDEDGNLVPLHWTWNEELGVEREEDLVKYGDYAARLIRGGGDPEDNELTTMGLNPVQPDRLYEIEMAFHDDDETVSARFIYQWLDENGERTLGSPYYGSYTTESDDWQVLSRIVAAPEDAAFLRLATRIYGDEDGELVLGGMSAVHRGPATQEMLCLNERPENADTLDTTVKFVVGWDESEQDWEEAELCPWECRQGFYEENGACVNTVIVGWDFTNEETTVTEYNGDNDGRDLTLQPDGEITIADAGAGGSGARSASATGWNEGAESRYWQISFSSEGFSSLELLSKQRSTSTGPRDFQIQYSFDGSDWYDIAPITVANDYESGAFRGNLPQQLEDEEVVYIRWLMTSNTAVNGDPVASGGRSNIDEIYVRGL